MTRAEQLIADALNDLIKCRADLEAVAVAAKAMFHPTMKKTNSDYPALAVSIHEVSDALWDALARPGVVAVLKGVKDEHR